MITNEKSFVEIVTEKISGLFRIVVIVVIVIVTDGLTYV